MNVYGCLWILMNVYGWLWMFMDVYGCLWGLENIFHIGLNGFQLLDMAS